MKPLFIIIHEEEVKAEHDLGVAASIKAFREIQTIKKEEEFRQLDGDPTKLLPDLPPSSEYKLWLCGSSLADCIQKQKLAAEKAGYQVEIYKDASIW